jgi:hypothetical protein
MYLLLSVSYRYLLDKTDYAYLPCYIMSCRMWYTYAYDDVPGRFQDWKQPLHPTVVYHTLDSEKVHHLSNLLS